MMINSQKKMNQIIEDAYQTLKPFNVNKSENCNIMIPGILSASGRFLNRCVAKHYGYQHGFIFYLEP